MTETDPLIGKVIADRYNILSVIGEGGMGRVYLAEHVRMGRKSAVKVMSPALALAADAISRFNREAANASRINHPNVAQIYDFGETTDGLLYLAMEFVEGATLAAIIQRRGPIPARRATDITRQAADALAAAHHLGIIHRDLKPENIMIASHVDGTDWVKVVDFGIAKTTQQSGGGQTVTTAGVSLGTPDYMSPEQLAGEQLDNRTDIYSLGLVCFNMLTGELPYPRLTSKETLVRRLTSPPQKLAEVRPDVAWPEDLQEALDLALAPESADRYDNVAEFGRAVAAATEAFDDPAQTVRLTSIPLPKSGARSARSQQPSRQASPPTRPPAARADALAHASGRTPSQVTGESGSRGGRWALVVAALGAIAIAGVAFALRNKTDSGRAQAALASSAVTTQRVDSTAAPVSQPKLTVDSAARTSSNATAIDAAARAPGKSDAVVEPRAVPPSRKSHISARVSAAQEKAPATLPKPAESPPVVVSTPPRDSVPGVGRSADPGLGQQQGRAISAGRHPWLRANGDSGAVAATGDTSLQARLARQTLEIQGHLQLAKQFAQQDEWQKVRQNFGAAATEATFIRNLFPGSVQAKQVGQMQFQTAVALFQTCKATHPDSLIINGRGITCESMFRGPAQQLNRGRRFGQPGQP